MNITNQAAKQYTSRDVSKLRVLLRSPEFAKIVDLCRPSDTLLGVLRGGFQENVFSRLLRYLLDSGESHGLGDRFLRTWLKFIPHIPFRLGRGKFRVTAHFNWSFKTEQQSNRFIDLVLVVSKYPAVTPIAVIGIETKIDASESQRQIEDYQRALIKTFPAVRQRRLLFLTPDGSPNFTGITTRLCPHLDIPYESIVATCSRLASKIPQAASPAAARTRRLLMDLADFLLRDVMKDRQLAEIDRMIKALEGNPDSAQALSFIRGADHRPTIRSFVYERVLPCVRAELGHVEIEWHYPESSARPGEFNFLHHDINKRLPNRSPFDLYYMLHASADKPTAGDSFQILLMAYAQKGTQKFGPALLSRLEGLRNKMPRSQGKLRQWGPWYCLWASAQRHLKDFTWDEAKAVAEWYCDAVGKTKPRLMRHLRQGK